MCVENIRVPSLNPNATYPLYPIRQLSPQCQMMLFSATYEGKVMEFAQHIVKNPIVIKLLREQESLDNIKQYYVRCRNQDDKYIAIQNIYGVITIGQAIIFCHVSGRGAGICRYSIDFSARSAFSNLKC